MIAIRKNYFLLIGITLLLLAGGCGGNKIDVSGVMEGIWKTDWTQSKVDGNLSNMDVNETLAFINDNEAGSSGKFRQVFIGTVDYDGSGAPHKVSFALVVAGQWQVVDINGIKLIYNLDNMSIAVSTAVLDSNKASTVTTMLSGDWAGTVSASLGSAGAGSDSENQVKQLINTYFRNQFREANQEKVCMKNVVVEGKVMTAKVNGSKVTYYKADQNVKDLNSASAASALSDSTSLPGAAEAAPAALPESSVAPVAKHRSTPAGLPNYDWLSTSYVSYNDLAGKSGSQLRIMRNYIYARHGYRFKSKDLQRYFAQYSWYSPMYSNVDHMLNKIERSNVQTISAYE